MEIKKVNNPVIKKTVKDFEITDAMFQNFLEIMQKHTIDRDLENKREEYGNISRYCWMTSYQIAIIYNREYENVEEKYGLKIGGEGTDDNASFAQKIAVKFATKHIPNSPSSCHFEYSQMSEEVLSKMQFSEGITSTVCGKNINLYRYKD